MDYDEINMLYPGFNGGWKKLMGPSARNEINTTNELVIFH